MVRTVAQIASRRASLASATLVRIMAMPAGGNRGENFVCGGDIGLVEFLR